MEEVEDGTIGPVDGKEGPLDEVPVFTLDFLRVRKRCRMCVQTRQYDFSAILTHVCPLHVFENLETNAQRTS